MAVAADGSSRWLPDPGEPAPLEITLGQLLDGVAERHPEREALVYSAYADRGIDVRWTFAQLRARSRAVARALLADGHAAGDRIAVWATNLPEWVLLQLGAAYAGLVLVPLNPLYRRADAAHVLGSSGAAACFVLPENRGVSLWDVLADAATDLPDLRSTVALGSAPDGRGRSWDEWLAGGDAVGEDELERRVAAVTPDTVSQIQFTSGTTGFPKGATLTNRGIVNNARYYAERAQYPDGGRHCSPMPFFHCGGCVLSTVGMIARASTLLPTVTFEADRMVATLEAERCTSTTGVPTMLLAIEDEAGRQGATFDELGIVATGGSPVPVDVERRWIGRFGVRFTITYGLTEASPVITQSSPDDPEERQIATCGTPLPHVEVDVVEPGGTEAVPLGAEGEVRTRGWLVMAGYWGDEAATAAAIDDDGFLRTGDLGSLDADGYLRITGRAKEMIIRGGENIYPAEVEAAIRAVAGVHDAAVVGVPSDRYGEEVAAFVTLAEGAALDADALRAALADRVARFKVPRHVRIVTAFPLTPSGKVQKFRLRDQLTAELAELSDE